MINSVVLSGNLTRDVEVKLLPSGVSVMNFSIANNERRKNAQTGEYEEIPNYFDCVLYDKTGKRVEFLSQHMPKGSKVCLEGRLRYRSWESGEGQRRSKVEVVANEIELFLPPRGGQQRSNPFQQLAEQHQQQPAYQQQQPTYQQPVQEPEQPELPSPDPYDDSIPF